MYVRMAIYLNYDNLHDHIGEYEKCWKEIITLGKWFFKKNRLIIMWICFVIYDDV